MTHPRKQILVIGSANVDMIIQTQRLPQVGETVGDGRFVTAFGGKGANQAVAAARAGGAVGFLVCVGDDDAGRAMLASFKKDGIDTSLAIVTREAPSGAALIMLDASGNNYLAVAPGANALLGARGVSAAEKHIAAAAMVVMQMEVPDTAIVTAMELAHRHSVPVLLNFAPARTSEIRIDRRITGLVVNEVEAEKLSGLSVRDAGTAAIAATALHRMGPRFVVITLGSAGACFADERGVGHLPGLSVNAVDTTGAGDTFCGALSVALVEGRPLPDAVRFANIAASISVTRLGAQPSIPLRSEIQKYEN